MDVSTSVYAREGVARKKFKEEVSNATKDFLSKEFSVTFSLAGAAFTADHFVARSNELEEIRRTLTGDSSSRCIVLHGLGGIGKTQLSLAYAVRYRDIYSAVFWLDIRDDDSVKLSFVKVAKRILQDHPSADQLSRVGLKGNIDAVVDAVKAWLGLPGNTRWLLIFDNYDRPKLPSGLDPKAVDIGSYLPEADQGSIIITTRSSEVNIGYGLLITKIHNLQDSLKILVSSCQRLNILQGAEKLARKLDGLPLALATAGAYLDQNTISCADYLRLYEDSWAKVQKTSPSLQSYGDRTLYSTWQTSFNRIEKQSPLAANLLRLWAYFDNQDIWFDLLHHPFANKPEWLQELTSNERNFDSHVRVLCNHGLVESNTAVELGSGSQGYCIHSCLHLWIQTVLNTAWDRDLGRVALRCIASHVPSKSSRQWWNVSRRLLNHATIYSRVLGNGFEADDGLEWALHNLGDLFTNQARLKEAEEVFVRALRGKEKALGPDHTSTIETVNSLGILYNDQAKLEEAEKMFIRALRGKEKALGPEHISTLETVNCLGILYKEQAKLEEAEEMYTRALQGKEKALGPYHTLTLETVNNLGSLYAGWGKFNQAEQMYKRALQGMERALGLDHTWTLQIVNNLGVLYAKQGRLEQAELCRRALRGMDRALGSYYASTLQKVDNLGILYTKQEKFEQTKQSEQAEREYEEALGLRPPSMLQTINKFRALHKDHKKLDQSEEMCERVPRGKEEALGQVSDSEYLTPTTLHQTNSRLQTFLGILGTQDKSKIVQALYVVDWNPFHFLEQNYPTERDVNIMDVITVTLSKNSEYEASTCRSYLETVWPSTGRGTTDMLGRILLELRGSSNRSIRRAAYAGSRTSLEIWFDQKLSLQASGPVNEIVQLGEQLAWIGAACRSFHDSKDRFRPMLVRPRFSDNKKVVRNSDKAVLVVNIDFSVEPLSGSSSQKAGYCWLPLFEGLSIADGFPTRYRPGDLPGLEMPLNMLTSVSRAHRASKFDSHLVLKGSATLFTAVRRHEDVVHWHMFFDDQGKGPSYNLASLVQAPSDIDFDALRCSRHFVGLAENIVLSLGTKTAKYDIQPISAKLVTDRPSLTTGGISASKYLGVFLNFKMGRREWLALDPPKDYRRRMKLLRDELFLIYDTKSKQASVQHADRVLLHLLRCRIREDYEDRPYWKEESFMYASPDATVEIWEILTYEQFFTTPLDEIPGPSKIEIHPTAGRQETKTVVQTTIQDEILHLYDQFEQINAHQQKFFTDPDIALRGTTRARLGGWSLSDIVRGKRYSPPHIVDLEPQSRGWLGLCNVLRVPVLFGHGLGDLISSAPIDPSTSKEHRIYPCMSRFSDHLDYLTVPTSILSKIYDQFGGNESKCDGLELATGLFWHARGPLFGPCKCETNSPSKTCLRVQELCPSHAIGRNKEAVIDIIKSHPLAAVTFGKSLINLPPTWKWSNFSGTKPLDTRHASEGSQASDSGYASRSRIDGEISEISNLVFVETSEIGAADLSVDEIADNLRSTDENDSLHRQLDQSTDLPSPRRQNEQNLHEQHPAEEHIVDLELEQHDPDAQASAGAENPVLSVPDQVPLPEHSSVQSRSLRQLITSSFGKAKRQFHKHSR